MRPTPHQRALPTFRQTCTWLFHDQRAVVLLSAFIFSNDLIFIGIHVRAHLLGSDNLLLFIDFDRGYAEFFQYSKIFFALILIALLAIESRSWRLAAWLFPFLYLLADDAYQFHEHGAEYLVNAFSLQPHWGLRALDFGELAVSGIAGALSLVILGAAYWRATSKERWAFQRLTSLIALLAFFGIIIDLVHIAAHPFLGDFDWIAVLEDGGEMIVTTLIVAFLLRLNLSGGSRSFAPLIDPPQA